MYIDKKLAECRLLQHCLVCGTGEILGLVCILEGLAQCSVHSADQEDYHSERQRTSPEIDVHLPTQQGLSLG